MNLWSKVIFVFFVIPFSILLASASSNVLDRFIHQGVVDYVYYHGFFNFAVFNFADVMIDFSIVMLIWFNWRRDAKSNNK